MDSILLFMNYDGDFILDDDFFYFYYLLLVEAFNKRPYNNAIAKVAVFPTGYYEFSNRIYFAIRTQISI